MLSALLQNAISASEQTQTHILDRAAAGIGCQMGVVLGDNVT